MLRAGGLKPEVAVRATSLRHALSIPRTACASSSGRAARGLAFASGCAQGRHGGKKQCL